ncbi:hypothetical protein [Cellulomonas sp. URHD0024]|uniref:hypothetical protein n=1 Tax=Cellulomonas sp. URHD0024 TaxID=1302620 RepID=UPI00041B378A|nr:hypothetical protein [Cellulomonas sp. URHD0024]
MPTHPASASLPAGLTETDVARITAALQAGRAPASRAMYASAWRGWARWCAGRDVPPLPASSHLVSAYLTVRAETGASMSTLELAVPRSARTTVTWTCPTRSGTTPCGWSAAVCAARSAPPPDTPRTPWT